MARALARGWGDPVLCSDGGSGRALELAAELGGEAAANARVAEAADVIVLCHKPGQLADVAAEISAAGKPVVSVLGATPLADLRAAYPDSAVVRTMPNTPVEVRRGVICWAAADEADADGSLRALFGRVGRVVDVEEPLMDVATGVMGVGPAYIALAMEAQVDAAAAHGLDASEAARMYADTLAGTAALLDARGHDPVTLRREVTSPGGMTERGLAVLEQAGLRTAYARALDAVLERGA